MRSHARRWLAWTLSIFMLAPYLVAPRPAYAQRPPLSVYVLDFNNKTTVGGALLGRVGAAQVSLQLSESPNWDVIPESQVQARIQSLNLQPPYDRPDRVRIGTGIDASAVVYGTVTEARVGKDRDGQNLQAFARIQVLVEDLSSGELINGALAEGTSTPRMGFTGDADILLEEALGKAAFRAREFMDRFRLPEGTVMNTTVVGTPQDPDMDALINIGTRQGVKRGMTMIVTRQKEVVGRMRITMVDSDVSTGRVTGNTQGVRAEDRVRAIFNFADFPLTRTRLRAAAQEGPLRVGSLPVSGGTDQPARIARADRGATFTPFVAGQDRPLLSQDAPQPPAKVIIEEPGVEEDRGADGGRRKILSGGAFRMLVGGLLVLGILAVGGRGGRGATRADAVSANGWQLQIGAPGAFIKIGWDRPRAIRSSQVLQYIVWRADVLGSFLIVGAHSTDAIKSLIDSEATRTVNDVFDGQPGSADAGAQADIANVPGIAPGQQYRYQIATAYENGLEDRDGDGQPDVENFMSPLSDSSPWVTAITPPIITDPVVGEEVQLDALEVTWQQTPGADTYFIWLSTNPAFPEGNRVVFGPFKFTPIDQNGDPRVTQVVNANTGRLRGANVIYLTVGGRNSNDSTTPKPFGAIFSPGVSVRPVVPPPPPPGGGLQGGGKRNKKKK